MTATDIYNFCVVRSLAHNKPLADDCIAIIQKELLARELAGIAGAIAILRHNLGPADVEVTSKIIKLLEEAL